MDDLVEWAFHALRALARLVLQLFAEVLLEYLISPLAKLIAVIYRPICAFFRVLFRFDILAIPLASLVVVAIFGAPFFIVVKAAQWILL